MQGLPVDPARYPEKIKAWMRKVWWDHSDQPMPVWLTEPPSSPGSGARSGLHDLPPSNPTVNMAALVAGNAASARLRSARESVAE